MIELIEHKKASKAIQRKLEDMSLLILYSLAIIAGILTHI